MSEQKRRFFCPGYDKSQPYTNDGDRCWKELPCEEHGVVTPAQGHARYGKMITEILPGEEGYDEL